MSSFVRRGLLRPRPSPVGFDGDKTVVTPVYVRDRTPTESTLKKKGPRLPRDKVLDLFSDGGFHSANELDGLEGLRAGDWVVAVRELIEYGYAFERRSNSLSLRRRLSSERRQDLADLLAGMDARRPEDVNSFAVEETKVVSRPSVSKVLVGGGVSLDEDLGGDEEEGSPFGREVEEVEESDRVVLSLDPQDFVVSGKGLVTSTQAILAKKRSGKTYLAMVMAEQLLRHSLPFVAVDPTGVWSGLRSLADGTPSPYGVLTLGGRRGHLSLTASVGTRVAELVVGEWPRSVILDLSLMEPDEQHEFVYRFSVRLFAINTKPRHVFFDEADEFAPQVIDSNFKFQRRCLSAIDRLVRRGGVKGIGETLITQRPAVINKNLLTQVGRIYVLNIVSPHDLEAVNDWMKVVVHKTSDRDRCLTALPRLNKGEVFVITNGAGVVPLVKFMTRKKETYDSSKTPTMDEVDVPLPDVSDPSSDVVERAREVLFPEVESADESAVEE